MLSLDFFFFFFFLLLGLVFSVEGGVHVPVVFVQKLFILHNIDPGHLQVDTVQVQIKFFDILGERILKDKWQGRFKSHRRVGRKVKLAFFLIKVDLVVIVTVDSLGEVLVLVFVTLLFEFVDEYVQDFDGEVFHYFGHVESRVVEKNQGKGEVGVVVLDEV